MSAVLWYVAISFICGGIAIALQTLLAERSSIQWRGVVLSIPSTLAIGLLFIGITQSPDVIPEATIIIPAVIGVVYLFVAVFGWFVRFGLWSGLMGAFVVWVIGASALVLFPPASLLTSIIIGLICIIIGYGVSYRLPKSGKLRSFPLNSKQIAGRSVIGGTVIGVAVLLANTLGPIWGGLFATFPAAFTSTFIIYYYIQGRQSISMVARSLFFPGSLGMIIYTVVVTYAMPTWGVWWGTLIGYILTGIFYMLWNAVKLPASSTTTTTTAT